MGSNWVAHKILICSLNRIFIILIGLSGCVSTASQHFPAGLSNFVKNEYLPINHSASRLKAFAAATSLNGGYASGYYYGIADVDKLVSEALATCNESRAEYQTIAKCKISYLGNTRISYKTESELNAHIFEYKNSFINVTNWSNEKICGLAVNHAENTWSKSSPTEVKEAKARGLDCGIEKIVVAGTNAIKAYDVIYSNPLSTNDIAVIIGNGNYTRSGHDIPNIPPATNDSQMFKDFAIKMLGISESNIIYLTNASSADLVRTFGNERSYKGDAFNWVRRGKSNLYVYYAGHGAPSEDGSNYIVPTDASADAIDLNGYPLETLYRNLSKVPSKSTTVILESCFSGNSQSGTVITNASPVYMKAKETTIPSNLTVLTAGAANQLASWTKDKKSGLFTHYYIKGMNGAADGPEYGNTDGKVSMNELQNYLDDTVTYYARRNYGRSQNVQITLAQ